MRIAISVGSVFCVLAALAARGRGRGRACAAPLPSLPSCARHCSFTRITCPILSRSRSRSCIPLPFKLSFRIPHHPLYSTYTVVCVYIPPISLSLSLSRVTRPLAC
ncbi:hypothetical protein C8Q76DRAFT_342245 [Earliella scabrosa]|nr:hypothetical protein C8Q76DRAFT_342245 [Earliella scabrosa]